MMTKTYFIDQDINNDNVKKNQKAKRKSEMFAKSLFLCLKKDTNVLYGKYMALTA